MQQNGNWAKTQTVKNDYLYNGKELNTEVGLNWNDYGARFYDPVIGKWNSIDPLADHYFQVTPYSYVLNNPINANDPDGRVVNSIIGGIVSAGLDLGFQVLENKLDGKGAFENIDGKSIFISGVSGAASGGLSTIKTASKLTKLAKKSFEVGIDVAESTTKQKVEQNKDPEKEFSYTQLITDAATGQISGLVKTTAINTTSLEKAADRKVRIALKSDKKSKVNNAIAAEKKLKNAVTTNNIIEATSQEAVENYSQKVLDDSQQ